MTYELPRALLAKAAALARSASSPLQVQSSAGWSSYSGSITLSYRRTNRRHASCTTLSSSRSEKRNVFACVNTSSRKRTIPSAISYVASSPERAPSSQLPSVPNLSEVAEAQSSSATTSGRIALCSFDLSFRAEFSLSQAAPATVAPAPTTAPKNPRLSDSAAPPQNISAAAAPAPPAPAPTASASTHFAC